MKVLSIEQMTKLKELGVDVEPNGLDFMYSEVVPVECRLMYAESVCEDDMKAFTLYDVINLLPKTINECILNIDFDYYCFDYYYYAYDGQTSWHSVCFGSMDNIMDGAYEMLVWVLEKGYLNSIIKKHENI